VFKPIGWSFENYDAYLGTGQVLLESKALIRREKRLEAYSLGHTKQRTVLRSRPASLLHGERLMAWKFPPESLRKRFVNENQQA